MGLSEAAALQTRRDAVSLDHVEGGRHNKD